MESQIDEAERDPGLAKKPKAPPDPAVLERQRTRESLELARIRVLHDLETTHNFRLEKILRASLKALDEKIAELKQK